jgi:hypothetical protein
LTGADDPKTRLHAVANSVQKRSGYWLCGIKVLFARFCLAIGLDSLQRVFSFVFQEVYSFLIVSWLTGICGLIWGIFWLCENFWT